MIYLLQDPLYGDPEECLILERRCCGGGINEGGLAYGVSMTSIMEGFEYETGFNYVFLWDDIETVKGADLSLYHPRKQFMRKNTVLF